MCKQIENTTKQGQRAARIAAEYAYRNRAYTYGDIFDAYERPSAAKVRAWRDCERLCEELSGYDMLISSRNTFSFSVVFRFDEPETGEMCYAYITRDYNRYCKA